MIEKVIGKVIEKSAQKYLWISSFDFVFISFCFLSDPKNEKNLIMNGFEQFSSSSEFAF